MLDFNMIMVDLVTPIDFAPLSGLKVLDFNTPENRLPPLELISGKMNLAIRPKLSEYLRDTFKNKKL